MGVTFGVNAAATNARPFAPQSGSVIEKGPVLRAGPKVPMRLTAPSRGDIRYHGQRRALELLAGSRDGCTEALTLAHSLSIDMMVMINSGLATAQTILLVSQEVMGGASEDAPGSRSQRGQFNCGVTLRSPF